MASVYENYGSLMFKNGLVRIDDRHHYTAVDDRWYKLVTFLPEGAVIVSKSIFKDDIDKVIENIRNENSRKEDSDLVKSILDEISRRKGAKQLCQEKQ